MKLTEDEITVLKFVELSTRDYDMRDPKKEPLAVARVKILKEGMIRWSRELGCVVLTSTGVETLERIKNEAGS